MTESQPRVMHRIEEQPPRGIETTDADAQVHEIRVLKKSGTSLDLQLAVKN